MGGIKISNIESLTEAQAKEISLESMQIKEHNIYFIEFEGGFGYSCLVFKNNHHIHYANDYELHHSKKTREELRQIYIKEMNEKLFIEAEISEPLKNYVEYTNKRYFLHNYYGMQVDYISIFGNPKEHPNFEKEVEGMIYNPIAFSYMYDGEFVKHHIELFEQLEEASAKTVNDYEYLKKAYLYEMYDHEYGINWEADYDVLSCFGKIQYHGDSDTALEEYFNELNFNDIQRKAYIDARAKYLKEANY